MERKVTICRLCGQETRRFGDHLTAVHKLRDFKKEKVGRKITLFFGV